MKILAPTIPFTVAGLFLAVPVTSMGSEPLVDANGPYEVDAEDIVDIKATGSDLCTVKQFYNWDLDYDQTGYQIDPDTEFDAADYDGPVTLTLTVDTRCSYEADDGSTQVMTDSDTTEIDILNVVPTIEDIEIEGTPTEGAETELTVIYEEIEPDDTVSITWEFPDETVGAGETSAYTFANHGEMKISVTVTDDDDGATTYTSDISVANVAPTLSTADNTIVDAGETYTVSLQAEDPGSEVLEWKTAMPDDASISLNDDDARSASIEWVVPDNASGTYTFEVTVEDDNAESDAITWTVGVRGTLDTGDTGSSSDTADTDDTGLPWTDAIRDTAAGTTDSGTDSGGNGTIGCSCSHNARALHPFAWLALPLALVIRRRR